MPAAARVTVVDASAIAAVLFDEPEAAPIAASVSGKLVAPTLLRYELASICTTKSIRHPQRAHEIRARYRHRPVPGQAELLQEGVLRRQFELQLVIEVL